MTYLEELQSVFKSTLARLEEARDWAAHGPTERASAQQITHELVEAHRDHAIAKAELEACLTCQQQASPTSTRYKHATLTFHTESYMRGIIQCYCPDCNDGDLDAETGRYRACNVIGQGKTESEALADYYERVENL